MTTPELPVQVKRNADLFEIGFVFLCLPGIVATMDRPPFHLGGKILLWLGTWFLIRRLSETKRAQVLAGLASLKRPLVALMTLVAVAVAGAILANTSGLERFQSLAPGMRWIAGTIMLPAFTVVVSLPLAVLTWGYLPIRFGDSVWLPGWLVASLPVVGFALVHASTLGWKAPLTALVVGGCAQLVFGRKVPLVPAILVHALIGWAGVVGGIW